MVSDYANKLWLQDSLNRQSIRRAGEAIQAIGRALPCKVTAVSGAIVTVSFEVESAPWTLPPIKIPKAESPWIRMPTQVGDLGVTMPADTYLGGVSGLGGGTADLTQRGNLTALVFVPVSNANSNPQDQNAAQIQGPNGAIIQTTGGTTSSVVTNTSGTTVTFGTTVLKVDATGITMTVNGISMTWTASGLTINGVAFVNHKHSGVTTGSGDTGGVV